MYVWFECMVSMRKSIKGEFGRIWMTDRAPYNIVFLDYLVYLVYSTTGSIGGNGRIRLLQNFAELGFVCIRGIWSSGHDSDTPTAEGSADSNRKLLWRRH